MIHLTRRFGTYALTIGLLTASGLRAQTGTQSTSSQSPPPQNTPTQAAGTTTSQKSTGTSSSTSPNKTENKGTFVRRFDIGATLTVQTLSLIRGGNTTITNSSVLTTGYQTSNATDRVGYGISAQAAITDHFAIAVGGYLQRMGYQFTTTLTQQVPVVEGGVVVPTQEITSTHQDTRTHTFEVPAMLRYYRKSRHTPGGRWFAELGVSWRDTTHIRSSLDSTDNAGNVTCCTFPTVSPARKTTIGYVVGAGLQFIDPFGIRVIPEVRYTRWRNEIFDSFSTRTAANQLEASFTLAY